MLWLAFFWAVFVTLILHLRIDSAIKSGVRGWIKSFPFGKMEPQGVSHFSSLNPVSSILLPHPFSLTQMRQSYKEEQRLAVKTRQMNSWKGKWEDILLLFWSFSFWSFLCSAYIVCCSVLRRENIYFYLLCRQVEISNRTCTSAWWSQSQEPLKYTSQSLFGNFQCWEHSGNFNPELIPGRFYLNMWLLHSFHMPVVVKFLWKYI